MADTHLNITRSADLESMSEAAADYVAERAAESIAARGRFTIALTGGSTPRRLYELLAGDPWRARIDWSRCFFFWGDDRVVPPDSPESNFKLANDTLLSRLALRQDQVHRVPTEVGDAAEAARAYDALLGQFFVTAAPDWPRFDVILLGLGGDGHVASLFPGFPTLDQTDRLVTSSPPGTLPPHVDRVTVTMPVLNAGRSVAFLVAGSEKAAPLRRAMDGDQGVPAGHVRPVDGELRWFVDEAATPFLASDSMWDRGAA